ncbi:MAG: hypothetical protein A3F46_08485 [Legionellales bacterium RIFCSPHIGHO2_12_FULL_42_9]|nr:MAG: hypothetical protein A3F46_08485 [Legionellales bacterium RIFCSPHIGHO2_12_FULL_42_9]
MALPTELQNATQSDSRSSSPGAEQYLFPRPSRLTFFDIALRRTTNHRFGHLDVVNTDSYKTATISCEDDALMDLLCRQIPRADEYTMKTLAYMQTWRLGILRSNIHDLQVELSRFEHMASSVANEINEREEANAQEECELFSLFYQVDNEQEDDTESEDDDVEVVSSLHQCPEEEGEEFEEEESDNGYGSRYNCLM